MKKIEKAAGFMKEHSELFQCPICKDSFDQVDGNSLSCINGHLFDISKKRDPLFFIKRNKKRVR